MSQETITYRPIGIIHSPFKEAKGSPIQGVFSRGAEGVVEVFEQFADGLCDLELFSHIYLLYDLHRAGRLSLTVVPFVDDQPHGVFATRAPSRPNGIGLSIVRVLARDGCQIRVVELDVLDGTPLLDIKPYVPYFDHRQSANSGWMKDPAGKQIAREADERFHQ